ncbi:DUF2975 domain-containing protein [Streptomyces triticagri]|uniref:DUF2975 domain-containing protein n=1 Tax=Streptomyces triticagri TaxID=2293568 RepID=A0A372LWD6_9ACTN|nr:DUF2975 domain-containing protein [Streptomyces triticagri]RFU82700.1 DUF2975 domain-containing protein [Streptomyces triticagri]
MHQLLVAVLRAGIAVAVLFGVFGQAVVIPTTAADEVDRFPPYAPYAAPYATLAILGVVCVQVALVALWILLDMVDRDAIFTERAFRWVDVIMASSIVATLLSLGATLHLAIVEIPSPDDGMDVLSALGATAACTVVGAAFAMLLAVLRGLLRKATTLQTEMAEVV